MDRETTIYLVIAGYMVVMLAAGLASRKFILTSDDFFRGGQALPAWAAGLSVAMGSFSALAFVAFGSLAFEHGILGLLVGLGGIIGYALAGLFVAHRVRRAGVHSPVEYLEERFGPAARQAMAWISLVLSPFQTGLRLFAFAAVAHAILGFDIATTILATGGMVACYTLLGGVWAVVMTDVIQFVILLAGTVPLVIVAVSRVGGIERMIDLGAFDPGRAKFTWFWLISWWISSILQSMVSFEGIQRYSAVANERDARKVAFIASAVLLPIPVLMLTPSLLAYYLYPEIEGQASFAHMAMQLLPPGLVGLMLGAMFAATMSSLSSQFGVDANIMTRDVFQRLFSKHASDRTLLSVSRLTTLGTAGLCMAVALTIAATQESLFGFMEVFQSRVLLVIWTPFLLGLFLRRSGARGLLLSLGFGFVVSVVLWSAGLSMDASRMWIIGAGVLGMAVANWLLPAHGAHAVRVHGFFERIDTPVTDRAARADFSRSLRLLRIICYAVIAFGAVPCITYLLSPDGQGAKLQIQVGAALILAGAAGAALTRHAERRQPAPAPPLAQEA